MLSTLEQSLAKQAFPTHPVGLYEPIRYTLEHAGKRLRPLLLLKTYALYSSDWKKALSAAVALETYHNHTLLHDDLMDAASLRRGKATVHQKWDNNTAILSGDTMLLWAYKNILATESPATLQATALFTKTAIEVCEGQQMDMNFEKRSDVSLEEYLAMIRLKTSVLLACACQVGAILAQAPEEEALALYRFGEKIGLAFQLQDDYLDCFGNATVFGKKIGGDIVSGKKTFLVHATLAQMETADKMEFLALLNNKALPENEKVAAVLHIYENKDVATACQTRIASYYEEARSELRKLSVDSSELWNFAESLMNRQK